MTPVATRAKTSAAKKGLPRSAAQTEPIMRAGSGDSATPTPASPLTVNVRHFHQNGLLRDEKAFVNAERRDDDGAAAGNHGNEVEGGQRKTARNAGVVKAS